MNTNETVKTIVEKLDHGSKDRAFVFARWWDKVTRVVEFNPKWENGTGYLDHATEGKYAPYIMFGGAAENRPEDAEVGQIIMNEGESVKGHCHDGRRFIILATALGCVIVFERYVMTEKSTIYRVVCNLSEKLRSSRIYTDINMTSSDITYVLGGSGEISLSEKINEIIRNFRVR